MGATAKRLIGGVTAAAERDCGFGWVQRVAVTIGIAKLDKPLDDKWAVITYPDFYISHGALLRRIGMSGESSVKFW